MTLKEEMRKILFVLSKDKKRMKELKKNNPQMYDLTMKVANEEERRHYNEERDLFN